MEKDCNTIIRKLESLSGRLDKESVIEEQAQLDNQEFFQGIRYALDNLVSFGVKQVPHHPGPDGQGVTWQQFLVLLEELRHRRLTGDAARDAISSVMAHSTVSQWNDWYRRILIKDLRCGVSEKTINKVLKGKFPNIQPVPVFEVMLAHDGANHKNKISGKKLLEFKLDGVRCITVIDMETRTVNQYTRNGKLLENFTHITDAIKDNIDLIGRSMVLDGEIISSSFQDLMKQVHRKENVQASDARLVLFDILPLSEFRSGSSVLGQRRRSNLLKSMKSIFDKIGSIDIVEQVEVNLDELVGELQFKDFTRQAIDKNYEGILIKDPDAKYECKRSTAWLKQKPYLEVSLTVDQVEEGTGKNLGKLGALVCSGLDDGKLIQVNVGSGFTDQDRDEFYNNKEFLIGQVVEVRADAVTQNQDGTYSLRFPRFLRFRGFRVGEKI
jgi:DNA ligase 1